MRYVPRRRQHRGQRLLGQQPRQLCLQHLVQHRRVQHRLPARGAADQPDAGHHHGDAATAAAAVATEEDEAGAVSAAEAV